MLTAPDFSHGDPAKFPQPEKLSYRIEWRLVTAGTASVQLSRGGGQNWQLELNLASAGLVNRLYQVLDSYKVSMNDRFCLANSVHDAREGKRHFLTRMDIDNARHKLSYTEQDLAANKTTKDEIDVAPCTYEAMGALNSLRALKTEPGKSVIVSITNGKKLVDAKIEAQARETIQVNGRSYTAVRYEALLFNNVIYRRKGRLFVWITDDAERIPIRFRLQMGFPVGTVSIELEKQERL
jgi:hypothetical protein